MNFDTLVQDIKAKAASASPLGNTLKFDFGGQYVHIDGNGDSNDVSTDDKDADCTVKVSMDDLVDLVQGNLNPMMAFMSGKIKVDGDMGVAMKLQSLLG